jgi:phosphoglycerol transferase
MNLTEKKKWSSVALLCALNVFIGIVWCTTYVKWTSSSWASPTRYLIPDQTDELTTLAVLKSVSEGDFRPFRSKIVKRLGAPNEANWNDYPIIEEIQLTFFGFLSKWFGLFAGLNLSLLLGHLLAGTCFFLVARYLSASLLCSFLGGLAYGLAPFLFAQSPHHITILYVWHLPLFIPVWNWVREEPGIKIGSKRFWCALGIGLLTGVHNVYFSYIFCQFVLIGAFILFWKNRKKENLFASFWIIASVFLGFCLMNVDTWSHQWTMGRNTNVLERQYRWLEIYGLKLVDMVTPPIDHQLGVLAHWGSLYRSQTILADEGSYLGIVGLGCFLLLLVSSFKRMMKKSSEALPVEFFQILWIFVFFTVGGINSIQGTLGFTLFRTGCRYSIVILLISLMYAVQKMSAWEERYKTRINSQALSSWYIYVALLGSLLIFFDQAPKSNSEEEDTRTEFLIRSDQEFTGAMEKALPPGAMVFQLPVMSFPESPVAGIDSYNHLRPYLYSKTLRFSFGSNKGRDSEKWQLALAELPIKEQIREILAKGFLGLYVNRLGYRDQAAEVQTVLKSMGYPEPIVSKSQDLIFFDLKKKIK